MGHIVSRTVLAACGPEACVNWDLKIEMICFVTQLSRSAPVKVKTAIQALSMLSSLALAMAVAGCTEEAPPAAPAGGGPAPAVAPAKPGGAMAPAAPAATPKAEEKK
jgi:hypothetical protein